MGRRVGPYILTEQLGRGGMGVVWKARDTVLDRDVAIKLLVPNGDDAIARENGQRFLVEAKAAAGIKSRHIAHVIQLGESAEGEAYIVMELLDGKTLMTTLMRERRLAPARAVRITRQIARGMHAAHALGIVHRDLKPANVMLVTVDGEDEVAKVLDFGVAKRIAGSGMHEAITQQGALLGTLQFMAPEQVNGGAIDARTDIYALGVLTYRMLAGAVPFEAESLAEMVRVHLTVRPKPLSERAPGISQALDDVVARCLEKDPEKRWQSMAELEQALAVALESPAPAEGPTTLPTGTTLPTLLAQMGAPRVATLAPPTAPLEPAPAPSGDTAPLRRRASDETNTFEASLRAKSVVPPIALGIVIVLVVAMGVVMTRRDDGPVKRAPVVDVAPAPVEDAKPVAPARVVVDANPVETRVVEDAKPVVDAKATVVEIAQPVEVAPVEEKKATSVVEGAKPVAEVAPVEEAKASPPVVERKSSKRSARKSSSKDQGFIRVHTKEDQE